MSVTTLSDLVVVQATSDYSAKIFSKMGFSLVDSMAWSDFVLDDGSAPFENVEFPTTSVYVKVNVFE